MFRPSLGQINSTMAAKYYGYELSQDQDPDDDLMNWMFVVYIPKDYELIIGSYTQTILDFYMKIHKEENEDDAYNIRKEFSNAMERNNYNEFYEDEDDYTWFVFLAICIENNFIVDAIDIRIGRPSIYNIEPATPRLKVRIK